MIQKVRRIIARNLLNYSGWSTTRRIVIIESDDWGSIRMPSREVYAKFLDKGIPVNKSSYCKYDTLASEEDLDALFTTLRMVKDSKDNHPVITANTLMANPDFDKIRSSDFTEYHYEKFTDTLKRYPGCENSFGMWKQGIDEGLFYPQFHGREHLNVPLWLTLLQQNHEMLKLAFDHEFWGLSNGILSDLKQSIQAACECTAPEAAHFLNRSVIDGLDLFEEIFGYRSKSFIAGNYVWDPGLEKVLSNSGIDYIQGMKYQIVPRKNDQSRKKIRHYLGEQNQFDQRYLVRNCVFEPSLYGTSFDSVQECLKDISNAFLWNKPAIITTHRLNFIGSLNLKNRERNLKAFSNLLTEIIETWPEVEFMDSVELGRLIDNPGIDKQ